ncbi:hypothetical protein EW145_g8295, partial [Phellinidium pouzarii]
MHVLDRAPPSQPSSRVTRSSSVDAQVRRDSPPKERVLHLADVTAPRPGNQSRDDE